MWGVLSRTGPNDRYVCISGSSLAAVAHLCGLSVEQQLEVCAGLRTEMLYAFYPTLRKWLRCVLPEDAAERCNGRLTVLLRRATPCLSLVPCTHWRDRDDLVDTLVAACSWWPRRLRDGRWYVDGGHAPVDPGSVYVVPRRWLHCVPSRVQAQALYDAGRGATS